MILTSTFSDQDREHLRFACQKVEESKRAPASLGRPIEAYWGAVLATGAERHSFSVFSPEDGEDAVKKLAVEGLLPLSTLYLTLEPRAGFHRLPPVTESVRHLGIKRVVLGSLDPALRTRGEGRRTLERMGIEVVLADGEEARLCQELVETYSRWLQRGLAVMQARVEFMGNPHEGVLKFASDRPASSVDAVICSTGQKPELGNAWRVVLDLEGWERPAEHSVLFQPEEAKQAEGARVLSIKDGVINLGALLRELAALGFLSVEVTDPALFRLALESGLVNSVLARFPEGGDAMGFLAGMNSVRIAEGNISLRLSGARLLDGQLQCLEARAELC